MQSYYKNKETGQEVAARECGSRAAKEFLASRGWEKLPASPRLRQSARVGAILTVRWDGKQVGYL